MKKLIPWESICFIISLEFFVVRLIYSDEELLAAKRNRLAVNRTFSGRRFAGCLPFFRVGQGGVLEKQEAAAEEAGACISSQKSFTFLSQYRISSKVHHKSISTSHHSIRTS